MAPAASILAAAQPPASATHRAYMGPTTAFPALPKAKPAAPAVMQPQAPCPPRVEVERNGKPLKPPSAPTTDYLGLRISNLQNHNVTFPRPDDVYDLAFRIHTCVQPFYMVTCNRRKTLTHAIISVDWKQGEIQASFIPHFPCCRPRRQSFTTVPPRIACRRVHGTQTQNPCDSTASTDFLPSMSHPIDTITATIILTIDRHLATLGL